MNKNGRYVVGLSQPGIGKKNWLVHRLVALVYIPNPERLPYVCHKEIAEMMGFGICLVRDYYNNYRNLTQGTHYYIHSKRKNKS